MDHEGKRRQEKAFRDPSDTPVSSDPIRTVPDEITIVYSEEREEYVRVVSQVHAESKILRRAKEYIRKEYIEKSVFVYNKRRVRFRDGSPYLIGENKKWPNGQVEELLKSKMEMVVNGVKLENIRIKVENTYLIAIVGFEFRRYFTKVLELKEKPSKWPVAIRFSSSPRFSVMRTWD